MSSIIQCVNYALVIIHTEVNLRDTETELELSVDGPQTSHGCEPGFCQPCIEFVYLLDV